ncbi:MAG: hypothetical protein QNJ78_06200 [Gammaproteobacteria bacterium]|nr:hypothetical protein [Gammaproteobacteria bacterium]
MSALITTRRSTNAERTVCGLLLLVAILSLGITESLAGPREQAKRIHDRLTGVPPSATVLNDLTDLITNDPTGGLYEAAIQAMENPNFYSVTLKNWATPWTNEEQTVFASLNDYTATVIGMVRDSVPFNQLLSADILYIGSDSRLPAYSMDNNEHYVQLEQLGINLKDDLLRVNQSQVTDLPSTATAGVVTSRAAARAFFVDGTNRAMYRFTMLNHLCTDLEQIKDPSRSSDRIRQDVSRSPGGDSRLFFNNCAGCHTGMEPLAQAYAYYDYSYPADDMEAGRIIYTPGEVQPKYLINATVFKDGYVTLNDHWDNYWRTGPNSLLGWDSSLPGSGDGAKSMGEELANSQAFAQCQAKKVFEAVCLRPPGDAADRAQVTSMTNNFKANNYDLKGVFADAAVYCAGE